MASGGEVVCKCGRRWLVGQGRKAQIASERSFRKLTLLGPMSLASTMSIRLYPVVSGASIVAKVTRDRALREWVLDETAEDMHRNFGSGFPGDPETKAWSDYHKHPVFGFPTLVRFCWGTCTSYSKDMVEVVWESDKLDEDGSSSGKRQLKLSNVGVSGYNRKSEDVESSGKGRSKFFQARKLELITEF